LLPLDLALTLVLTLALTLALTLSGCRQADSLSALDAARKMKTACLIKPPKSSQISASPPRTFPNSPGSSLPIRG